LAYQTPNAIFAKNLGLGLVESLENATRLHTLSTSTTTTNNNKKGNLGMSKVSSKIAA
jgi:hypothetical protein